MSEPTRHQRCAPGELCVEVSARHAAAVTMITEHDCWEHAEQLIGIANRIAAVHRQENEAHRRGTAGEAT